MEQLKSIKKRSDFFEILPKLSVKEIEDIIKTAAEYYYNTDKSIISDEIYDLLVERLIDLKPNSKVLKKTGADIKGKKVELPYWMGSMNKIKSTDGEETITKWTKKYSGPYVISDKLDGISCLITYDSKNIKMYTRGNGVEGQDITHLSKLCNTKLNALEKNFHGKSIAIRGELIMSKDKFKKYEKEMSNPRNLVAGVTNAKKSSVNKDYAADTDLVVYEIIEEKASNISDQLKTLKKLGLNVVNYDTYPKIDSDILSEILKTRKSKSIYDIDGIIVTDNKAHSRNESGNPEYAFAFKGLTPTAEVKVLEVIWDPSKDGLIIPRIHYQKIRLSQVDMEYAAGFNAKYIEDNKIGKGAVIKIIRSGDVIPYIMEVIKPAKKIDFPDLDYEWDKNHVNILLKNADKNDRVNIKRITKFVTVLGVDNMSEGIITRLFEAGFDDVFKIIQITVDDMLELEGFKEKLANKLYDNLQEKLKNIDILTLMDASNVFGKGFGETLLKKILNVYPKIVDQYDEKDQDKWKTKMLELEDFDTIRIESFLSLLPKFQKYYHKFSKIIKVKPYVSKIKENGRFEGQKIVFTGFRSDQLKDLIENEGGKVSTGAPSKNTTLLVYADGEEDTAKFKKAVELGVDRITRSAFEKKWLK